MSQIVPFPAEASRLGPDAVVVIHAGQRVTYDDLALFRRAVAMAELPEVQKALEALEARVAAADAQAQAAGRAALALARQRREERAAEAKANAVRLGAVITDQLAQRRAAVADASLTTGAIALLAGLIIGAWLS